MRKLLAILLTMALSFSVFGAISAFAEETEGDQPETAPITHVFGGENGEWETDADNSAGVWSYYSCLSTVASRSNLTLSEDQTQYVNAEAYLVIRKDGFMHPGASDPWSCLLIGYTVEKDGILNGRMSATKAEAGGNGTIAMFVLNDDNGWLCQTTVETVEETVLELKNQSVKAGDTMYLLIHHYNDIAFDGATYVLTYTLEDAPEEPEVPVDPVEETVIKHVFGGENGEWETDADNSAGVWNYYTCLGTMASRTPVTLSEDETHYFNGEAYFQINKSGFLHPGAEGNYSMPIVGYKVEKDGILNAKMVAAKESAEGNGTIAFFVLNDDDGVLCTANVNTAGETTMEVKEVEVKAGDEILFFIHHNNDIAFDGATYVLTYELADKHYEPVKPAEPTEPKLTGELDSVNNVDDFRFVQGAKNFYYLYGKVSEGTSNLQELSPANITWDTAGYIPYLGIRMDGMMHPAVQNGEAYMAVLGWKADSDKTVDLHLESIFDTIDNPGDGVTVKIYKNEELLLSYVLTGKDNAANDNEPIVADINRISLNKDDMIYLAACPNDDMGYDGVFYE
ncbi:MAG: hypothetical protein IJR61_06225, partial [Clostridia bacterium]|nr:hypothetical protein [Clostridia bacterium]